MFPSVKTRFSAAARRGFDLAIEFATLGEYGAGSVVGEPSSGTARTRAARENRPGLAVAANAANPPRAKRLRPATAAARRLQPAAAAARRLQPVAAPRRVLHAAPAQRISTRSGMRGLAFDAKEVRPLPGRRKRAGSARPRPQPCLVADARQQPDA
jgi:hypothetical protein